MKIVGYSDRLSAHAGHSIQFMISSEVGDFAASLVRLYHGDIGENGPGFRSEQIESEFDGTYPGEARALRPGSYLRIPNNDYLLCRDFTVRLKFCPTTPQKYQVLLSQGCDSSGFALLMKDEKLGLQVSGRTFFGHLNLSAGQWYEAIFAYNAERKLFTLHYQSRSLTAGVLTSETVMECVDYVDVAEDFLVACRATGNGNHDIDFFYNGKIEEVQIYNQYMDPAWFAYATGRPICAKLIAHWDFSLAIDTWDIIDISGNGLDGKAFNQPTRAVTGSRWDASTVCWKQAPDHYGAIHFHDDDLSNADWKPSITWIVPDDLASGVYALHASAAGEEDYIPFVIAPRPGLSKNTIALVLPTLTYMAYGNEQMVKSLGMEESFPNYPASANDKYILKNKLLSTYDTHSDGSGVCFSSRLRPLVNMRPKVLMHWLDKGKGSPHGLNADLCIVDWLHTKGFEFDVLTDEDLHHKGISVINQYRTIISGSHHEYWSYEMIAAVKSYLSNGGKMMNLSGNGMYWVTQIPKSAPHSVEVRRCGPAQRTWDTKPGETYLSSSGEQGGTWRYRGITPQSWVGVGTACETSGPGRPFVRQPGSFDPNVAFIFEGIGRDELIGDFPNLIQRYGAAGYEFDRADVSLGTPSHTVVLASATGFSDDALVVSEDSALFGSGISASVNPLIRCDMTYLTYPKGGAVFSSSSISWVGALSFANYNNNVSRITENVLLSFVSSSSPPQQVDQKTCSTTA